MKDNRKHEKNSLSLKDWSQTEKEVFAELEVGDSIRDNNVELIATAKHCKLKLTDGRQWECDFYHDVESDTCKYSIKDGLIEIQASKLVKCEEWPTFQSTDESGDAKKNENETQANDNERVITHAKYDIFEKDSTSLNLNVFVKLINRETFDVDFQDEKLTLRFSTREHQFLMLNAPSTSSTIFKWAIDLKQAIIPAECTCRVLKTKLDICLKKKEPAKWGVLEKAQYKTTGSGTQRGKSAGAWMPLNSSNRQRGPGEKEVNRGAAGGAKSVDAADSRSQKPTCAVPPLSLSHDNNKQSNKPVAQYKEGYTGLDNLGNTCFMNSVLQVLANTRELKDYMLDNNVKNEINTDNPLGTGGHMVLSFAVLMRLLWSGKYRSYAPMKLKTIIATKASQFMGFAQHDAQEFMAFLLDGLHETIIATKASQFMGFAQHDAQEFMAFLLDGLHEDLNRIREKPYTETVDSDGRPDEVVAECAWATHKKRNDSFIVDLFQGQYKSKLVCPECGKVSITFDPFMQLSVPLPKKKRYLPVVFLSKEHYKKPMKYIVPLSAEAGIDELKAFMSQKTKVQDKNMRVFEVTNSRVHKVFNTGSSLSSISFNDMIFVCEVLDEKQVKEPVVEVFVCQRLQMPPALSRCSNSVCRKECTGDRVLKRCTKCLRAAYCDQACQKEHWINHKINCKRRPEPVGCPFVISLPQSHATYARLCQAMEGYARYSTNVFQPPVNTAAQPISPATTPTKLTLDSDRFGAEPSTSECGQGDQAGNSKPSVSTQGTPDANESATSTPSSEESGGRDTAGTSTDEADVAGTDGTGSKPAMSGVEAACDESKKQTSENVECSDESTKDKIATATVVGQPQLPERMPPFFIKPVNMAGQGLPPPAGDRLSDKGDEPLPLSQYDFIAMDWRNDPKQQNYVMVDSKELEYEEDESMYNTIESEKNTTLDHCLQLFTKPEKLAPDEAWYCPKCKQHREATKEMSLWRMPSTLIIQLKRFSFKNMIWRDKIDKMIYYPTRGLDLSPYCHYKDDIPPIYDLYGVINHHGGILGGHYTSFARLPSVDDWGKNECDWRLFDDSHVTMASEKNVLTHSAYLLFYRKRQTCIPFVPRPIPTPVKTTKDSKLNTSRVHSTGVKDRVQEKSQPAKKVEKDKVSSTSTNIPSVAQSSPTASASATAGAAEVMEEGDNKEAEQATCRYKEEASEITYTSMEDID